MMTTILVPLDFSETADNALIYAVGLANYLSANIIMLHVESLPVYDDGYTGTAYTMADGKATSLSLLKERAVQLKKDNALIGEVNYYVETGDLKTIINHYVAKKDISFIVMGISGHGTKIGRAIIGSNAVSLSRECDVPVFIVPKNYSYKKIKNIAYASEYDEHIKEQTGVFQVKYISTMFGAEVNVVHVIPNDHLMNKAEAEADLYVEEKLENTNHKTYILSKDEVSMALLNFVKAHDIDLIVMEQKKHSFLYKLLHTSTTKDVAFDSPVPLLTIKG